MIDGLIYKFFGWLDDMTKKVEDVLTFDVGQELKKKKRKTRKCKYCHCKCHCKDTLHLQDDYKARRKTYNGQPLIT